ncbi:hypothetical protein [Burkholderia sp. Ac-20353]|uniref:hypothetical protein n=1 Tax=Burkholderia sp. Ac-20353 TaxID=2703894 RepID=UPI00197C4539|nr:hypothetical protein [Burkholderia sp. Ac-20353]MBN3790120.1 hypothetical protein [Burkholderia sp. Ac-20353]
MISGITRRPGRRTTVAFGTFGTFARSAQNPPPATRSASPLVVGPERQLERGPVQPTAGPTRPGQEVRKLR